MNLATMTVGQTMRPVGHTMAQNGPNLWVFRRLVSNLGPASMKTSLLNIDGNDDPGCAGLSQKIK